MVSAYQSCLFVGLVLTRTKPFQQFLQLKDGLAFGHSLPLLYATLL